ncbi:MAG TPA: diaminopimelate epimerase [Acidimicrobiia bacterium]|nr:diaminopimelate epimerase [Acidimicrobiia bacterium]
MRFTKMHGLGNDFVLLDEPVTVTPELVRAMCDRHFGIGADGVLTIGATEGAVRMGYWNADGSEAEMCGNGLRCVARVAVDRGLAGPGTFVVDTPAGPRRVAVGDEIRVDLGSPTVSDVIEIDGRHFRKVSVGNPHAVTEVDDLADVAVAEIGPAVQPHFPTGANVEFVRIRGGAVEMRVWERGVGETLACGSGIVAVAAVARRMGGGDRISVTMPGGTARVDFEDGGAWLVGPAEYVFEGEWGSGP